MKKNINVTKLVIGELCLVFILCGILSFKQESVMTSQTLGRASEQTSNQTTSQTERDYIKWVDFDVSYEAMCKAYEIDLATYDTKNHISFVKMLALVAAKQGGSFDKKSISKMEEIANVISSGEKTWEELCEDLKYYAYYYDAYTAAVGNLIGEYELDGKKEYGLKCFSPIAKGFEYSGYDDFGTSRSYGFKREHLGHDMMGRIGTPIINVETGVVEALGWNQYGGWRIGIRSLDKKRYYYYAHLRQNFPYVGDLEEGMVVTAGEVIGYMGHTGYSKKENTNNIDSVHLHFGLQLIFDESQKDCNSEIWIDVYALTRFLAKNQMPVEKQEEIKEWRSICPIMDPDVTQYVETTKSKQLR